MNLRVQPVPKTHLNIPTPHPDTNRPNTIDWYPEHQVWKQPPTEKKAAPIRIVMRRPYLSASVAPSNDVTVCQNMLCLGEEGSLKAPISSTATMLTVSCVSRPFSSLSDLAGCRLVDWSLADASGLANLTVCSAFVSNVQRVVPCWLTHLKYGPVMTPATSAPVVQRQLTRHDTARAHISFLFVYLRFSFATTAPCGTYP
jgi:hypothetical protein